MSLNRYAKNVANHATIVTALRAMGCTVETHTGTTGAPDLIVGCFGINALAEVKPDVGVKARRELRDSQRDWHERWKGARPVVLRNVDDCAALFALLLIELGVLAFAAREVELETALAKARAENERLRAEVQRLSPTESAETRTLQSTPGDGHED